MRKPLSRKITGILIFLTCILLPAAAEEPESLLAMTLGALEESHPAFRANEASFAAAGAEYASGKALLGTQLDLSVPLSGTENPLIRAGNREYSNLYSITGSPKISINRLLPTGGTLSAFLDDSLTVSNYDTSSSIYYESPEPEWANTLTASFRLHQPLVFRGVYKATVSQMEYSFNSELSDYISTRNSLVLQAARDVYDYKMAAYRAELVEKRRENDNEVYKRTEREFELGARSRVNLVQARAALLQTEADLLKAEQTLQASVRRMSSIYDLTLDEKPGSVIVDLAAGEEPGEEIIKTALQENPGLTRLRNSLESLRVDLLLKAKDHAPTIDTGVSYSYNHALEEDGGDVHSIAFNLGFNASLSDGGAFREAQQGRRYRLDSMTSRLQEEELTLTARIYSLSDTIQRNIRLAEKCFIQTLYTCG